jgi:hypothetical protein
LTWNWNWKGAIWDHCFFFRWISPIPRHSSVSRWLKKSYLMNRATSGSAILTQDSYHRHLSIEKKFKTIQNVWIYPIEIKKNSHIHTIGKISRFCSSQLNMLGSWNFGCVSHLAYAISNNFYADPSDKVRITMNLELHRFR